MHFKMLIICITFVSVKGYAQREVEPEVEIILESVADNVGDDYDFSDLVERLNQYRKTPLNINTANAGQLGELLVLSPLQIANIKTHIAETGPLLSLEELQTVQGLDMATIQKLLPFLTVKNSSTGLSLSKILTEGKSELMLRYGQVLQKQKGYNFEPERSHYFGGPQRYLTRYRFNYANKLLLSFNAEKDAGEPFFARQNKQGFDFYSGSVAYINPSGKIKKLLLGDYTLQFGQGLSMYTGLSFGKGADISNIPKVARGLMPYTSTNETLFFRGAAATIAVKNFSFTPFISLRKMDASMDDETGLVGSVLMSGYHRTQTELDHKAILRTTVYGGNVSYNATHFNLGFLAYQSTFNHTFEPGQYLYNQFEFAGKNLTNTSIYGNASFGNAYFFGEVSKTINAGLAYLAGSMLSLSPKVSVVMLYRNYPRNYQSFFNQALSENSFAVNEKGLYTGVQIKWDAKWAFTGYADVFRFPWLKYRVDAPGNGYELFGQMLFSPTKKTSAYIRYRYEKKPQNEAEPLFYAVPVDVSKQNLRFDISFPLSQNFTLKYRAEGVYFQKESDKQFGRMILQDVIYRPPFSQRMTAGLRLAWFKTDSYDSRIYAFENDVLYSYAIPAYFGRGFRTYLNTRITLKRGLDVWARYALFSYQNQDSVGSGLEEIAGNKKSDFKVQIRLQF